MPVTESIRLSRKLGEGGMGCVWVAHHATLHADVVVKFLASDLGSSAEAAARFAKEAATIARVRSPHIVQVLDHGTTPDGRPFIVMELLEGEDLGARLFREKKLSLNETARTVAQVAAGLGRAHELGIVHRDIKPANIFLCSVGSAEPFVKVLDFGVAKGAVEATELETASGTMVGTPAYMSPEQLIASRDVDHRSDLWALAAVAFRALVGSPPFRGESIGALALEIHAGQLPSVCARDPSLPASLDGWFERAFQRDPAARFQSASEMASALLAIASKPSAAEDATTLLAVDSGPRPRRPSPFVIKASILVALAAVGGFVVERRRTTRAPAAVEAPAPPATSAAAVATSGTILGTTPPPAVTAPSAPSATASNPEPTSTSRPPRPTPRPKPSSSRPPERDIE
jgi:serine/threonine-protein kinase